MVVIIQTFDVAPDPGEYPEYYEAVDYPMDLETLRHRVQTFFYDSVQEFNKDVRLLIRNAKDFNAPKSQAYLVRQKGMMYTSLPP